ncbi:MAG: hypothetical protein ACRYHQ_25585, partial [Janthinobacterium lividum]
MAVFAAAAARVPQQHRGAGHRRIKRLMRPGMGFGSLRTASRTLAGYEAMAIIRKGRVHKVGGRDVKARAAFVADVFWLAA